jgi:ubiquinone/menaquinone biosynthesis C-methylase UbiE
MTTLQIEPEVKQSRRQASPALVFDTLNRYQHTMALKGAIDLDLFSHIAQGASTAADLAVRTQANERAIRILCDFLTIIGFLNKSQGHYELTHESSLFLDKQSPAYIGSMASFLAAPSALTRFRDVAALVRKGSALDTATAMEPDNDLWVDFARFMAPVAAFTAQIAAPAISEPGRRIKVLDIAAGHGLFGISVARHNPAARVVGLDWKNVLEVAKANAAKAGVSDRYETIAGSAFDVEFGSGYDLVLVPNFMHHFDPATNVRLLKKVRAAMNPGAKVAVFEFVPNSDRVSPAVPASFSMVMLAATEGGDAYTFQELESMLRYAGFGNSRLQSLDPTPVSLIVSSY